MDGLSSASSLDPKQTPVWSSVPMAGAISRLQLCLLLHTFPKPPLSQRPSGPWNHVLP